MRHDEDGPTDQDTGATSLEQTGPAVIRGLVLGSALAVVLWVVLAVVVTAALRLVP